MANDLPPVPPQALPPRGINHMVLNVRNLEVSHNFWTEIIGFHCVAELKPIPGRQRPKMRFYSGLDAKGDVTHHDLALAEVQPGHNGGAPEEWNLMSGRVGLNHVAIAWPDRESWLKQLAFLQSKGVPFLRRVNHGMTHSVYIADPDGHGIEVLYELPREVWEGGYRPRAELRRDAPDGRPRVARRSHGESRVRGTGDSGRSSLIRSA